MSNIERRHGHGSIRAKGDRKLGGLGIPYNVLSDDLGGFRERIAPGAFTASIETDDIRSLFNHDSNFVLGRLSAKTLRLSEDERGISYEVDTPDTTWARDLTESIRRGDISENSFAFFVNESGDTWTETATGMERTVLSATLKEIGPQPFAAYPQSDVAVRSIEDTLRHGKACVGAQCQKRGGQDPDVLLRELELDLGRPGRTRTGGEYSDVLALLRELDDKPAPKVGEGRRAREWPSQSEYTRLRGNSVTGDACRATAFHESGHAVHALLDGCRLDELSLLWQRERNNGTWKFRGGECVTHGTDTAPMHLAGSVASEMAGLGEANPKSWSALDHKRAQNCTSRGVLQDRLSARAKLKRHWGAVKALATALLEHQRLDGQEAESIIMGALDQNTRARLKAAA